MSAHERSINPGKIMLLGSGEAQPAMRRAYDWFFAQLAGEPRLAVVETPAGFEPNSAAVAGEVGRYFEKRLQNYRPQIDILPARKRGTTHSPNDPALAQRLFDANIIFMGPGSPTYAIRQLSDSVVWDTTRAMHRLGANLIFASAMTIAISRLALPVYELYKVGEDLHWKPGLNLFSDFGLSLVFIPHWNNRDGGAALDTSRCYMGQNRFGQLLALLPTEKLDAIVGIDENTALILDPVAGEFQVLGQGRTVVLQGDNEQAFAAGERFEATLLGDFCIPQGGFRIPPAVWERTIAGISERTALRAAWSTPPDEITKLVERREKARAEQNWSESDHLRDQIANRGWQVQDTPTGPQLIPQSITT